MFIMKLKAEPFEKIKSKEKIWEIRLNDEKRRNVHVGDVILFKKMPDLLEGIVTRVVDKKFFKSFREMAQVLSLKELGFDDNANADIVDEFYHTIYSVDKEKEYGIVALKLELV